MKITSLLFLLISLCIMGCSDSKKKEESFRKKRGGTNTNPKKRQHSHR